MDRRDFLKNLVIGVAGLYVPKTLYFDMKPRNDLSVLSFERLYSEINSYGIEVPGQMRGNYVMCSYNTYLKLREVWDLAPEAKNLEFDLGTDSDGRWMNT